MTAPHDATWDPWFSGQPLRAWGILIIPTASCLGFPSLASTLCETRLEAQGSTTAGPRTDVAPDRRQGQPRWESSSRFLSHCHPSSAPVECDNEKIQRAYLLEVLCKLVRSVKLFLTLRRLASTYGGGKTRAVISLGGGFRVVLFFIGEVNGLLTHLGKRRDDQVVPMPKEKWEKKLSLPQTICPPRQEKQRLTEGGCATTQITTDPRHVYLMPRKILILKERSHEVCPNQRGCSQVHMGNTKQ